jgi:Cu2+-exporting ATPase
LTATRQDGAATTDSGRCCYHCGLPLDPAYDGSAVILGRERPFCCPGCKAVADSIVGAGLDAYYEHRSEPAATAEAVPEILRRLAFYDHPDVQSSFVRARSGLREASLVLENIRCAACLWLNERVLRETDGVVDVDIDYASHHARVRWDPARVALSAILRRIVDIGYVAHPYDPARREELATLQQRRSSERLLFAGVIGMAVMQFAIAGYVMGYSDETGELALWVQIGRWTSLFATTLLLAYPGQEFFVGAWRDLRNRRLGIDVPIALGLGVAYFGSLHTTVTLRGEVYYDSIAMFVFFVLLARRIELRGRLRAADAVDRLARIQPRTARRLVDGVEQEVLVTELQPGDRVRLRPGEVVPSDGRLLGPASSFDESLLTGEPLPVERGPGDRLTGGSCNVAQAVDIEILRRSGDSTLAEIHRLLTRGQSEAPRYALLAQRVAAWFVAGVLLVACVTAIGWTLIDPGDALRNTVTVLIVTCPCALALATPVAMSAGVGRLAGHGALLTRHDALEVLADAEVFAFDKTGTLTTGDFEITTVHAFGGLDPGTAKRLAAALERDSEHPLARALRAQHRGPAPTADGVRYHVGQGIEGTVDGTTWRIGKPAFALAPGGYRAMANTTQQLRDQADALIALSAPGRGGTLFVLRDAPRADVGQLLERLRRQGVDQVALLSGDDGARARRFAAPWRFDTVQGDMSPADKLAWIRQRQAAGARVVMVGDGINDAPTLAGADASVSLAHATELAQVNSSLLILNSQIEVLGEVRAIARHTRRVIRQNLSWAAAYNFLAVPFAALGFIPPWGAALGMSASSLLVVANALRLRQTRPGGTPRRDPVRVASST